MEWKMPNNRVGRKFSRVEIVIQIVLLVVAVAIAVCKIVTT